VSSALARMWNEFGMKFKFELSLKFENLLILSPQRFAISRPALAEFCRESQDFRRTVNDLSV
jgi:hypothetical protein